MPDMTTRNNEDPADPSVHKQRLTDELDVPDRIIELICAYGNAREDKDGSRGRRLGYAVDELRKWCADQMREAVAAERERRCPGLPDHHAGSITPKWWKCPTHGAARPNAWGCPECVREMRSELSEHRSAQAAVYVALGPDADPDRATWPDQIRALRERADALARAIAAVDERASA